MFLLAETGLFDGRDATIHWSYVERVPCRDYPPCASSPERTWWWPQENESELVSSGASMSWHDLVLYLIARHVGSNRRAGHGEILRAPMAP